MKSHCQTSLLRGGILRVGWLLVLWAFFPLVAGCQGAAATQPKAQAGSGGHVHVMEGRVAPAELETLNRAFADRYVMRLVAASDAMLEGNPDEAQCRRIRSMRAYGALSMYDIVTEPDPYLQTLNLTVVVTLQTIAWGEEGNAQKQFGERGSILVGQLKVLQGEAWEIAGKLFSPADLEELKVLLRDWRSKNKDMNRLANARFTDLLQASESGTREKAKGLFSQIEQTRQSLEDTRALAERALYLSKRAPLLLTMSGEATVDALATNPSVAQVLADFHTLVQTADHLPATLDVQRKAVLADFDERRPVLEATVKDIKETLAQASQLAADAKPLVAELHQTVLAVHEVLKQGDAMAGRYLPSSAPMSTSPAADSAASATSPGSVPLPIAGTSARAFDIQEYTAAMKEASQAARDLNVALLSSEKLLDSPTWRQRIDEINEAADGRVHLAAEQSQMLVNGVFRRVYISLGALLVVLVFARLIAAWILHKRSDQRVVSDLSPGGLSPRGGKGKGSIAGANG